MPVVLTAGIRRGGCYSWAGTPMLRNASRRHYKQSRFSCLGVRNRLS